MNSSSLSKSKPTPKPVRMPILYSFRRCPYAMRARLAIAYSGVEVELREVVLRNKPEALLAASAKATVPVLVCPDGSIIDESFHIMHWALKRSDPAHWLRCFTLPQGARTDIGTNTHRAEALIAYNDGPFKTALDRYKYTDRLATPENQGQRRQAYRLQGEVFLRKLEDILTTKNYLFDDQISCVDMALAPFIRQFVHVDKEWFRQAGYAHLQVWLETILASTLFTKVMKKYLPWVDGEVGITVFSS